MKKQKKTGKTDQSHGKNAYYKGQNKNGGRKISFPQNGGPCQGIGTPYIPGQ